ncbi:FecR domain-containing protein [Parabacteroides segnis]|jgi:transmembrane sensor|uniref:FecR domain-containing protein n=1 Tax=Parabacteroides segnis TaxID=2763058 RepID=A0ABR7E7Q1_9BACT|nr:MULTISPECIES: FecR domain-containing protein [Parabacteroides]MBC5645792.1 FecR domain-containing protein [Parabacteroides segnis]MCM0715552.1 FecR domain-containing protein [Parabacteroides sp. TA-V-105]
MHILITKYFEGEITAAERKLLFSMIQTDEKLRKDFSSVQNLYALSSWLPNENDEFEAVDKLAAFKQTHCRKKRYPIHIIKHAAGYAAAICITILSTWMVMNDREPAEEMVTYEEFTTPSGQRAMVKLHDGTTVWLNARSTLRYPNHFAREERKVELDGEAFFDVEHNEHKPFVVSTEKLDIKVLGTKFNVFAYKGREEFNTALLEGSVKVYERMNEEKALFMNPNECVELKDNKLVKRPMGNTDFLLWKEGIYAFDDVPFEDIIKKFELYYDIVITVNNSKLMKYKFSGKFRQRDGVESALRTLRKVYYFTYIKDEENNNIIIR